MRTATVPMLEEYFFLYAKSGYKIKDFDNQQVLYSQQK